MNKCLSFDDVLLEPKFSDIKSRSEISIGSTLGDRYFKLPIISSPMDTVTESAMAASLADQGGLGIIHRYNTIEEQSSIVKSVADLGHTTAAAIGVSGDFLERARALYASGAHIICIDIAHGHHILMQTAIKKLRETFGNTVKIIAGNVATAAAYSDLQRWGADVIRVGIGGGSICSTRIQTGHGMSTLSSIMDCAKVNYGTNTKMIADGGFKKTGDIVKAIAAGADFIMLGSMLAGTEESPGEVFTDSSGKKYKAYRGMASRAAQLDWRGQISSLEGVSTTIPYKGPVDEILSDIARNIRSGFSYSGARHQEDLREKSSFMKQSPATQVESSTHILYG